MSKSDELNAKIIKDLLKDGRKKFSDIAKENKVPVDIIAKRFRQMKQEGTILGATIQKNYKVFGYSAVGSVSINVDSTRVNEVIEYIQKIPDVFSIYHIFRRFNIKVITKIRTLNDLDRLKEKIRAHPAVIEIKTDLWTDVRSTKENIEINPLVKDQKNKNNENAKILNKEIEIDDIDKKIIEKLAENGRMPFRKLAQEIQVSNDTVIRRYEKLKKINAIKVMIQVNPTKLGYQSQAIFKIILTNHSKLADVVEKLSEIPDVVHVIKINGDYDLEVMLWVRSFEHLFEVESKISKIPNAKIIDIDEREISNISPKPFTYLSTF
ncbi:MAG: Lrp/AsnC family transcriptional regulator [Crenarchaeota archaeon]|nr:Lrp/AsnC family transcriptional regulator [Thermoproteota archaeon]